MGLFDGLFGSSKKTTTQTVNTSSNSSVNTPATLTSELLQEKAREIGHRPYEGYQDNRIAGFTPDQMNAFGITRNISGTAGNLYDSLAGEVFNNFSQSNTPLARDLMYGTAGIVPGSNALLPASSDAAGRAGDLAMTGASMVPGALSTISNLGTYFPDAPINDYMNPYVQSVLDPALQDIARRTALTQNQLRSQSAKTGSFGGSRTGVAEGELERNTMQEMGRLSAEQRAAAFKNASDEWRRDQTMLPSLLKSGQDYITGAQGQQRGAIDATNAALSGRSAVQQQGLTGQQAITNVGNIENQRYGALQTLMDANKNLLGTQAEPLLKSGTLQQALSQAELDKNYQDFLERRDWELHKIPYLTAALNVNPAALGASTSGTSTSTGTVPGPSPFQQILGGTLGAVGTLGGGNLFSGLGGIFSGGGASTNPILSDSGSFGNLPYLAAGG